MSAPRCQECPAIMEEVSRVSKPTGDDVVYECPNEDCPMYKGSDRRYRFQERVFEPKR